MESAIELIGAFSLIVLVAVGLLVGWLAGLVAGRQRPRYFLLGVLGAVVAPFLIAALGVGILAAGGLLAFAIVGLLGAVAILLVARAIFD